MTKKNGWLTNLDFEDIKRRNMEPLKGEITGSWSSQWLLVHTLKIEHA